MIIDPVKTELAIRQDLDEMRTLRQKRLELLAQIDQQIAALHQQRESNSAELARIDNAIARWDALLAPDPETKQGA